MSISAAQIIYANVEADLSPRRVGGFQTLFYTQDLLSADEVDEIEPHLIYVHPTPGASKTAYFMISTGRTVIARMHSIDAVDSAGRGGRYLAHAMVLSPEDFKSIGCNPFRVLDGRAFCTTLDEALSAGNPGTGVIPPADIDARDDPGDYVGAVPGMDASILMRLVRSALLADRLCAERRSVVFTDGETRMLSALRGLFAVLPARLRSRCTFDTDLRDCNRAAMDYWALGLPGGVGCSDSDIVPGKHGGVLGVLPRTMYERWITGCCEDGRLEDAVAHAEEAFALDALSDADPARMPDLDAGFLRWYLSRVDPTSDEVACLVRSLVGSSNAKLLEELTPYAADCPASIRHLIRRAIAGRDAVPESFMAALGDGSVGLWDRLRGVLRRQGWRA